MILETCQRGCIGVAVNANGRVVEHDAYHGMPGYTMWGSPCRRSGHPSREELARRKARREAKRAALVAELQPVAMVALDALIEGRPEYQDRIGDLRRAALYEFNRRNKMRHRHAFSLMAEGLAGDEGFPRTYRCRYCRGVMQVPAVSRDITYSLTVIDRAFAPHLTQCALEYLAGIRVASPEATP